ncbi:MAG: hypothetical protein PVF54_06600 [Anaerolineae bacterium]
MGLRISPKQIDAGVWGAQDGSIWKTQGGNQDLAIASLPATQVYVITLTNRSGAEPVDCALHIAPP